MSQYKQIIPFQQVKESFLKKGYEVLEDSDIQGVSFKIKYRCLKHPNEIQSISWSNFKMGRGCKFCGIEKIAKKLSTPTEKVRKIFEDHDFQIVSLPDKISYTTKIPVKCNLHPDVIQNLSLRNLKEYCRCQFCSGRRLYAPDIKKEIEEKGFEWLNYTENIKKTSMIEIKCKKHNEISRITIEQLKKNKESNLCEKCQKEQNTRGNGKHTFSEVKKLFEEEGYTLLSEEYINCHTKLHYLCPKHGEQEITLEKFQSGQRCPSCRSSKGEWKITEYLKAKEIAFVPQKKFKDCKYKAMLPFDFYLPDFNACIEYQGIQHYQAVPFRQKRTKENYLKAEEKLKIQKECDLIKKQFCKDNQISLLEIKYYEYDQIEKILEEFLKKAGI